MTTDEESGLSSDRHASADGPKQDRLAIVPFEELEVGKRYGPFAYRISKEQSDNLRGPVGVEQRGDLAPPGVFPVLFLQAFSDAMGGIPPGGVLAREELEFHREVSAEAEVKVGVSIGDAYVKRDRPRAMIEFTVHTGERDTVATGRMVILWASVEEQRELA